MRHRPDWHLIFCHGWGFEPQSMHALAHHLHAHLPQARSWFVDLGFSGRPALPNWGKVKLNPCVAIGHSYGFAYLLQQAVPWHAMVAINGFTHFCRVPGKKHGLTQALLDSTHARLALDPDATVCDFYARCGSDAAMRPAPGRLLGKNLAAALLRMRDMVVTLPNCPWLAIAGDQDKIIPPALSEESFASSTNGWDKQLIWAQADHLLPVKSPALCAEAIAYFLRQLILI
jgi:pimeloyl-[acyl-carrier protein] methyl ester esterase